MLAVSLPDRCDGSICMELSAPPIAVAEKVAKGIQDVNATVSFFRLTLP